MFITLIISINICKLEKIFNIVKNILHIFIEKVYLFEE